MILRTLLTIAWVFLAPLTVIAGEADVVDVKVRKTGPQTFSFDVTVRHGDTGWEHYANRWDVVTPDGKVLGKRILHHPHENEQPFTRSLSGVKIPTDITTVTLRANDKVHALGGVTKTVKVPH
ncbi:MAG: hypothetical protein JXQ99_28530 [Hyphomicrobiaceae bacterium]